MINNSSSQKWDRLKQKSLDNQFINKISNGLNLSPFEARATLDTVHEVYGDYIEESSALAPGQSRFVVLSSEVGPSVELKDAEQVIVTLTINNDKEDLPIKKSGGTVALRRHRLQRIVHEAFMQGGLLTVEDLANRIFCCGERTIVRDLQYFRKEGVFIPLRSTIKDMGRTLSHRSLIVRHWCMGDEYSEIARKTNHSVNAISNYVRKFKQTVVLMKEGYEVNTIAFLTKISKKLTEEYIDIYAHSDIVAARKQELEDLLKKNM